jgi:hypothetical protein
MARPRLIQGSARKPAIGAISTATIIARSDRPPATASAPVTTAAHRQRKKSQPAARNGPTPSSATVVADQK